MKIKFLMAGVLSLVTAVTFAQTKDLKKAQEEVEKSQTFRGQQATMALFKNSLNVAKGLIDKAVGDPKNANLAQTYAVKGEVYAWLTATDSTASATASFTIAEEALKKAKELDTKGEFKKLIDDAYSGLAQYQMNLGVKAYQSEKYDDAYKAFAYYNTVFPEDTTGLRNAGLSALNAKNYPGAITSLSKLVTTKYSDGANSYNQLAYSYLATKDTANALKVLGEALVKYPNDNTLRKREIEVALQSGKTEEVISKINAAIEKDSKNKELYFYAGLVYGQSAEAAGAKIKGTKDAAGKAALKAKRTDYLAKAAEAYKKALEIDPNYFDANSNLGSILMDPAIEAFNEARKLPANATQKQYDAALAKAGALFDAAKPYLDKAVALKPDSKEALGNLLVYYQGKRDQPNIDKYNKLVQAAKN